MEVLVHQWFCLVVIKAFPYGLHYLTEAFHVLGHVHDEHGLLLLQQLFDAPMQDALVQHLQLSQLPDKLDVAKHLPTRDEELFLLIGSERAIFVEHFGGSGAILKFILTLV